MNCLVTGGGGFLGSEIARQLVSAGHKVRVLLKPGEAIGNLRGAEMEFQTGDIRDKKNTKEAVKSMDYVFHAASLYESTPFYVHRPEELYRVNLEGTKNVCQASLDAGVKKVVYTSSCAAVGLRDDGEPSDESIELNHLDKRSHYEKSKALAEKEALSFHKKGLWVSSINPSFLIGAGDSRPTPTGEVIIKYLNRAYPFYFDAVLYLSDLIETAKAHLSVLERGKSGERYIVCFDQEVSLLEFFRMLEKVSGVKKPKLKLPLNLIRIGSALQEAIIGLLGLQRRMKPIISYELSRYLTLGCGYNNAKAKMVLGFQSTPIEDSLRRSVEWYLKNGYIEKNARVC